MTRTAKRRGFARATLLGGASLLAMISAGPGLAANVNNTTPNTTGIVLGNGDTLINTSTMTDSTAPNGPAVLSNNADDIVSITNSGTITGTGSSGIAIGGDGVGGAPNAGADLGTFLNTGTVTAGSATWASAIKVGGNVGNFTNQGTLSADRFNTVFIYGSVTGTFLNDTGGLISSLSDGAVTIVHDAAAVINRGTIRITSTFLEQAVHVGGRTQTFTNTGTIEGPIGVRLQGGMGTGTNSGTITGATTTGGTGINIQVEGGVFANDGTISGYDGYFVAAGATGATLVNRGRIHGEAGGAAITLSNQNDSLTLETTSVIEGLVDARGGTDGLTLGGNTGSATFAIDQLGPTGQFRGFESLVKTGDSNWTFTGDNAASMNWLAGHGSLTVNGLIPNSNFTLSAITFKGNGTVGNLTAQTGTTIAPGNSVGTLHTGNVSFEAGSTYAVEVGGGVADLIASTGTVTIAGATTLTISGATGGTSCTAGTVSVPIITATGGVTGTFGTVTSTIGSSSVRYDANNVFLDVTTAGTSSSFGPLGTTPNQSVTGYALDALGCSSQPYSAELNALATAGVPAALDALSGEAHAAIAGVFIDNSHYLVNAIDARIDQAFDALDTTGVVSNFTGDPLLLEDAFKGVTVWGSGYGGFASRSGNSNAAGVQSFASGFVIGADGKVNEDWRLGLLGGLGFTSIAARDTTGSSIDAPVGGYAAGNLGVVTIEAGAAYTRHFIETSRSIVFPGVNDTVTASYQSGTAQAFLQVSHDFDMGNHITVSPFGRLEAVNQSTDGFTETGGAGMLTTAPSVANALFVTLGVKAEDKFVLGDTLLVTAHGSLGWRHAFADALVASNSFTGGGPFSVTAAPIASDVAVISGGLVFDISEQVSLSVNYDGAIGAGGMSHAVKATLSGKF